MWNSNLHYNLLQQGTGKYEEGEESEVSSQKKESSQEKTENLEPWSHIFDKAEKRHETQLNELINEYEGNRDSGNVARVKADGERSSFCLQLKDSEGYDWLELTELAIDKRKFLLNQFYENQTIPQDQD